MEEETQANIEVVAQSIEAQTQNREEESCLDGEFIKVEKETFDMKGNSPVGSDIRSTKEEMEAQEKVRGLEIELKSTFVELAAKDGLIDEMYKELELVRCSERVLKSTCAELETKLKLSKAEHGKSDSFSAQVILRNAELEHKLKSYEQVVSESNSGAEETRLHLQDREAKLEAGRLENKELEQRLALFESKHIEKLAGLHLKLKELETDKEQMNGEMKYHQDKVSELELTLGQSSSIKSELEAERNSLLVELKEAESLLQLLRRELKTSQVQLEQQEKVLEEATAKTTELESLNATLVKDSELKLQEAEKRAAQLLSENELLAETNAQLNSKVSELQHLLESAAAEKEESARKLASHMNRMTESSGIAESRKLELDRTLAKVQDQEKMIQELREKLEQVEAHTTALAEANMKLNEELAMSQSRLNGVVQNLSSSMRTVEDLTRESASERQRLQTEISSIMEHKQSLNEANVAAQNQLLQLEVQLKECKESNEAFKAELEVFRPVAAQNSTSQARLKEVEEKLLVTEAGLRKETEEKCKLECAARQTSEELEAEAQKVVLLEKHVKELEQRLHAESVISKEKGEEAEVRSRDVQSSLSSPTKSKKPGSASAEIQHKIIEAPSTFHSLKLVLGVALVSIIIGLILGKKY